MNNLPKESRKINLLLNQKPLFKIDNKPMFKLSRIKSQDDINKFEKNEFNPIYNKITPKNPSFNKNILLINPFKKLNNKNHIDVISQNKKPLNRTNTLLSGSKTSQNKRYSQHSSLFIEQENEFGRVVLTNTLYDDIKIRNIISLWNELEVMESYRKYFFFIYKEIDDEDKNNFYQNEINELIQLKNDIKSLTYNIELRFGIIKLLTDLNNELNNSMKKNPTKGEDKYIITEMIKKMEDLSIHTVNIVLYMKKIKSIINLAPNLGKYDMDLIARKFNFDKNYIIKMKLETNFLREGYARIIFNLKNDQTPFFIKAQDRKNLGKKNDNTYSISLDQKVINRIKECNYYIYKELIAYENDKAKRKIFRCISPIRKNKPSYNYYNNNINLNIPKEIIKIEKIKKGINNDKRENKNENLCLNLKPKGKGLVVNRNDNFLNNKSKKDSAENLKLNNSAKVIPSLEFSNNKTNFNKDNILFNFEMKMNNSNKNKQRNKNSDFDNFQSEYNINLFDTSNNKSEIISPKVVEYPESKQAIPPLEISQINSSNKLKENQDENKKPET